MKKVMLGFLLVGAFGAATCTQQQGTLPSIPNAPTGITTSQGGGKSPSTATMKFGMDHLGSPFPPGSGHDASAHAKDNIVPRTVVIDRNGSVRFELPPSVHQVAIYRPGTEPGDIDTTILAPAGLGCPPAPLINDPTNRLAVLGAQACAGGPTVLNYTFTLPGRHLVICTFLPHFVNVQMYGWVNVRN
jgi:hypothetical protein